MKVICCVDNYFGADFSFLCVCAAFSYKISSTAKMPVGTSIQQHIISKLPNKNKKNNKKKHLESVVHWFS